MKTKAVGAGVLLLVAGAGHAKSYPPPIQALIDQGVEIGAEFETPAGLTGYAVTSQGQPFALYLTPDGAHVIVGSMLDDQGHDLTPGQLDRHLPKPELDDAWPLLEGAAWIREGRPDAERVVYVFTDPDCPYCRTFWRASHEYLDTDVQVRNILVGVLTPTSLGKAARILAADDPALAFFEHQTRGSRPLEDIPADVLAKVDANNRLMEELEALATPTLFFRDADGKVRRIIGMPSDEQMMRDVFRKRL